MVCTVNAPGTLIPVACWKLTYLFFDLFVQWPKPACHSEHHAVYRGFCYRYGINHCDDFVYSQILHSMQLQHGYHHHEVYSKSGIGKCQSSFPGAQFFAVDAASSFNGYPCNFGFDLFNIGHDTCVLVQYFRRMATSTHITDIGICRHFFVHICGACSAGSFVPACRFSAFCFAFFLAGLCINASCISCSCSLFCTVPLKCKYFYLSNCISKQYLQSVNLPLQFHYLHILLGKHLLCLAF